MTIRELYAYFDEKYPRALSCDWDNDGLLCTIDADETVRGVTVALDAVEAAIMHTAERGHNVLLTHHPIIFRGIKEISGDSVTSRRALAAIKHGVSVMSFHTRLDSAFGGVNDALAKLLGAKLLGTFGNAEAPQIGRYGELDGKMSLHSFAALAEARLGAKARIFDAGRSVGRVAFVGGSGGDFISEAREVGADTFVVGEISYHVALDAADDGLNVIELGHAESELPICEVLQCELASLGFADTDIFKR